MFDVLWAIIFILPAYFSNAFPVIVGGGTPIDFGKNFTDGKRLFGESKTIRGFLGGIFGGILASIIIVYFFPIPLFDSSFSQFLCGILLSIGAMVGDLVGSFIKRRVGISSGRPFILDQLSFLIVALLFAFVISPSYFFDLYLIIFLFVITYIAHVISNYVANRLGLKNVPW